MAIAPLYPMFLDLVQHPVLIVGGGAVALRKARGLIECAARVTVVSPEFLPDFDALPDIEPLRARYAATHMSRKMWRLAFAATNSPEVNQLVHRHAAAAGIFCCRCDEPDLGDFSGGATARVGANRPADGRGVTGVANLGGVTLAVSTTGASPRLAARICRQAAAAVDPALASLANLLSNWRARAKKLVPDHAARRVLLMRAASQEMEDALRKNGEPEAQKLFSQWLSAASHGDPEFLNPSRNGAGEGDEHAD